MSRSTRSTRSRTNNSTLLDSCVIYLCPLFFGKTQRTTLLRRIKAFGGNTTESPSDASVTHFVCNHAVRRESLPEPPTANAKIVNIDWITTTLAERSIQEIQAYEIDLDASAPVAEPKKAPARRSARGKRARSPSPARDDDETEDEDEEEEPPKTTATRPKRTVQATLMETTRKQPARSKRTRPTDVDECNSSGWQREADDSVMCARRYPAEAATERTRIAAFDMDGTLIDTKSGRKFALGRSDWRILFPQVITRVRELYDQGYRIVIFSNQLGIAKGHMSAASVTGRVDDVSAELGVPVDALLSIAENQFRKPGTDMWDHFVKTFCGGQQPDLANSIYVGDAAGRPKDWQPKRKKDFSASDRKFAHNVGLKFHTPEEFFLNQAPAPFTWDGVNPRDVVRDATKPIREPAGDLARDGQEVVLFVGFPAAGKSTFARRYLVSRGYFHVNRDKMSTQAKCIAATRQALARGESVVVDNTNPSPDVRAPYITAAQEAAVPIRCFHFQTSIELAKHLNMYRENTIGTKHVPGVGFNMYKSKFREPTTSEGFEEVARIHFVPDFSHRSHPALAEKLFYMFT